MAKQMNKNASLVDLVMPLVGMKDATFNILKGSELKLIDSVVWSTRCKKFMYFTFCITHNECVCTYRVVYARVAADEESGGQLEKYSTESSLCV